MAGPPACSAHALGYGYARLISRHLCSGWSTTIKYFYKLRILLRINVHYTTLETFNCQIYFTRVIHHRIFFLSYFLLVQHIHSPWPRNPNIFQVRRIYNHSMLMRVFWLTSKIFDWFYYSRCNKVQEIYADFFTLSVAKYRISGNIDSDFNLADRFSLVILKSAIAYNSPLAI